MLNLFANFFGHPDNGRTELPSSVVKQAIERAVDATDPRVRIHSGYARLLREPVIHAIEYVIAMVDSFPVPVVACKGALTDNTAFAALMYSEARMEQIIARDAALREFRAANPKATDTITALLVAQKSKNTASAMPRSQISY